MNAGLWVLIAVAVLVAVVVVFVVVRMRQRTGTIVAARPSSPSDKDPGRPGADR